MMSGSAFACSHQTMLSRMVGCQETFCTVTIRCKLSFRSPAWQILQNTTIVGYTGLQSVPTQNSSLSEILWSHIRNDHLLFAMFACIRAFTKQIIGGKVAQKQHRFWSINNQIDIYSLYECWPGKITTSACGSITP